MASLRPVTRQLLRTPQVRRLLWCSLVGFAGFAALVSALPLWAVREGVPAATAGLVTTTATLVGTVATQFAVPAVVARLGIGRSLAVALVLLGAPTPAYLVATDPVGLAAVSAVRGVGFGLLTVIGSLLVALLAPRGAHGSTAGLYGLSIALPTLLAVPGAVLIAQRLSFTWVFVLATVPLLGVPAALAFGPLGRRGADGGPEGTGRTWRPSAARAALAPTLVLVVVTLAAGGLFTFVPIGLGDAPHLAPAALLVLGTAAALGRWAAGGAADRYGPGPLLPPAVLVTAAGAVVVSVALDHASSGTGAGVAAVLVAGSLAAGVGYGAVQSLTLVSAFADAGPEGSATASTVWNAGFDAGTAAGAALVGAVAAATGIPIAVGLTAAPVLAALPVALLLRRRPPP